MSFRSMVWFGTCILASTSGAAGCGGSHAETTHPVADADAPDDWTQRETWSEVREGRTYLCATGVDNNLALSEEDARAASSSRSREALSRMVETSIVTFLQRESTRQLITSTSSTTTASASETGGSAAAVGTQGEVTDNMTRVAQEVSSNTLHGVETFFRVVVERDSVYAKSCAAADGIVGSVAASQLMDEEARQRIQENTEEARILFLEAVNAEIER